MNILAYLYHMVVVTSRSISLNEECCCWLWIGGNVKNDNSIDSNDSNDYSIDSNDSNDMVAIAYQNY